MGIMSEERSSPVLHRLNRRHLLRVMSISGSGAIAASFLAACGSRAPSTKAQGQPVSATVDGAQSTPVPVTGGTLAYAVGTDVDSLDPPNQLTMPSETVDRLIYDGLVAFSPTIEIIPGLAEKWDVSSDGLMYTFNLRPNLKFHDGTSCDADAVKYCYDRMLGPEQPKKKDLHVGIVATTKVVDPTTFQIVLLKPFASYINNVAHIASAIYSPTAHKKYRNDLTLHPTGTGPFKFTEWQKGDHITLERWDESWRGKPYLDKVIFKVVPDDSSRVLMLQSGDTQLIAFVPPEDAARLKDDKKVAVDIFQTGRVLGLSLNTQHVPFKDKRVRQALNYAIDKDSIVKNIYQGMAIPSGGPSGPLISGSADIAPYPYDVNKAKELLAEAGLKDGFEITLLSPTGRFLKDAELVQEVQKQLRAIGVTVKLNLLEYAAFTAAQYKPLDQTNVQMFLQGWVPSTGEARWTMFALFNSTQWVPKGSNGSFYSNPQMDELIDKATMAVNIQQRNDFLKQAQQLAHDDAVWVYLVSPKQIAARSTKLHNPWLSAFEMVTVSEKTWLER